MGVWSWPLALLLSEGFTALREVKWSLHLFPPDMWTYVFPSVGPIASLTCVTVSECCWARFSRFSQFTGPRAQFLFVGNLFLTDVTAVTPPCPWCGSPFMDHRFQISSSGLLFFIRLPGNSDNTKALKTQKTKTSISEHGNYFWFMEIVVWLNNINSPGQLFSRVFIIHYLADDLIQSDLQKEHLSAQIQLRKY